MVLCLKFQLYLIQNHDYVMSRQHEIINGECVVFFMFDWCSLTFVLSCHFVWPTYVASQFWQLILYTTHIVIMY